MKNAVLVVNADKNINVGDYIQGLASSQFFDNVDLYLEREKLSFYDGDECRIIMNGWFMHNPNNWPPAPNITPMFVAFHINSTSKEVMLNESSVDYLKRHQPIGCRDYDTMNMLNEVGVDAYFSGCMTLTLGEKYRSEECDGGVYFVDVCNDIKLSAFRVFKLLVYMLFNVCAIKGLWSKNLYVNSGKLRRVLYLAAFYKAYRGVFNRSTLLKAEYITQIIKKQPNVVYDDRELMVVAQDLVQKYAKASLVVTSRIHCALPSLGLETPVVYVDDVNQDEESWCRLKGIKDLFNVVRWSGKSGGRLECDDAQLRAKLLAGDAVENRSTWKKYRDLLVAKCSIGEF